MRPAVRSALWMGLYCALTGLLVGFWVRQVAVAEDYRFFPSYAASGAALAGAGLWWLLLARRGRYGTLRGAVAGGLAGLLGHYLCWYLAILAHNLCYWGWGGCQASLPGPPVDPLNGLWAAALFSLGSLFFFGWLTIPLGAAIGALWARRQARRAG